MSQDGRHSSRPCTECAAERDAAIPGSAVQASDSGLLCRPSQVSAVHGLSRPRRIASTSRAMQAFSLPPPGRQQGWPARAEQRGHPMARAGSVGHSAAQRRHCTGPVASGC